MPVDAFNGHFSWIISIAIFPDKLNESYQKPFVQTSTIRMMIILLEQDANSGPKWAIKKKTTEYLIPKRI